MARLAGLEPTTSASAGLRSIQLSYKRLFLLAVPVEEEILFCLAILASLFNFGAEGEI